MSNDFALAQSSIAVAFLLFGLSLAVSCAKQSATNGTSGRDHSKSRDRLYDEVSEFDLSQMVISSNQPVLIEFGVDFNCVRCSQMTPSINALRNQFDGQAQIVRTSYSPSSAFQSKLGLQICPTYLFYDHGELVDRCDGPTMLPVLISKLSNLVSSEPGLSAAIHPEVQP